MSHALPSTGPELRALREKAGYTLADVAGAMGSWESALSFRERADRPLTDKFVRQYLRGLRKLILGESTDKSEVLAICDLIGPDESETERELAGAAAA